MTGYAHGAMTADTEEIRRAGITMTMLAPNNSAYRMAG